MDVLLVGADNPVGIALQGAFAQWGRHEATLINTSASRWRSERQAKKVARKGRPHAVVDLRIAWQLAAGETPGSLDLERSRWLAKACERSAMHYLLLSSDRVFSGRTGRTLRETDPGDATEAPGAEVLALEAAVQEAAPSALILRTGPLFAGFDNNPLTRVLDALQPGTVTEVDDRDVFCPVASVDAARVLSAILDQMAVGARARGIYHYCSGDRATAYALAEASLAAVSQYRDCGELLLRPSPAESDTGASHVLDCTRLQDTFAIKQVPWRGFVNAVAKQYCQQVEASKTA